MPELKNYYFTAVMVFGVPMYLRDLTYDEARKFFDVHCTMKDVAYCQYGSEAGTNNMFCKGATF